MTEDIPYTHRFVANFDTRKRIAHAFLGHAHRTKRQWVRYSLVLVLFTALQMGGSSRSLSLGTQVVSAIVFAFVPTLIFAVAVAANGYFRIVRGSKLRLFNGAIVESGFGEEEMVIRNPISSGRMAYRGIKSVTVRGDVVFIKHHGIPIVAAYPRELFPDEAIDRILRARR